jgi:hypothetical protein
LVDGPGDVRFGWSIGNVGDLDGDGHGDLVVGAPYRELSPTVVTGSVTVLSGASGSVLYELFGAYDGDEFGMSVRSVGGDIDGDGANDFIVGAPQGGGFYPSHGYAQTISGASGAVLNNFVEYSYDSTLSVHYGAAVAGGDFDGDGRPDVLIGDDFFSLSNGIIEAWTTAGAGWSNYDAGWAGTLGVPSLTAGSNPVIGQPIDVYLGNSAVSATAGLLLVGVHETKIPTGKGGTLLVDPHLYVPLPIPPVSLTLSGTLPNDPSLCGLHVYLQALEVDVGASKGISFSPGLDLAIGYP